MTREEEARQDAEYWLGVAGNYRQELEDARAKIERLRQGYEDIKAAAVAGRVCDDVAWFDAITTLYDFCDLMLNDGKFLDQQTGQTGKSDA